MLAPIKLLAAVAVCLILLVVSSIDQQVAAAKMSGCMPSLTAMFCAQTKYKRLSDYLNKETKGSEELKENVRVIKKLIDEDDYCAGCSEYDELVLAFAELRETPEEGLCTAPAAKGLRHVAEAMHRDIKTSPGKTPSAVRRLNQMIIKLIKRAHSICPDIMKLEGWRDRFFSELSADTPIHLAQLDSLARTLMFEDYQDKPTDASDQKLADDLNIIIATGHYDAPTPVTLKNVEWDEVMLKRHIQRLIRVPCDELMRLPKSKTILQPYVDILISSFIITHGQEARENFFDDEYATRHGVYKEALDLTLRLGVCSKLKTMDEEHLINVIMRKPVMKNNKQ